MWCTAEYEMASLFSLKLSTATASGGKTLLLPSPYAIKMALLDAACRVYGVQRAQRDWPILRDLRVALRPPPRLIVTHLFQRVLRPRRANIALNEPDAGAFQRTIGYREYVQMVGRLGLALTGAEGDPPVWMSDLLLQINYFGKRGGFFQLVGAPDQVERLTPEFVELTAMPEGLAVEGTLQPMDDCTAALTFARANIYSPDKPKAGRDRISRLIALPYRLVRSSRSFTQYDRIERGP